MPARVKCFAAMRSAVWRDGLIVRSSSGADDEGSFSNQSSDDDFRGKSNPFTGQFDLGEHFHFGNCRTSRADNGRAAAERHGVRFEMADFYHSIGSPASTIVHMLKVGDEVSLEFVADAYTTEAMRTRAPEFHGAELKLGVWRGESKNRKRFEFILDMRFYDAPEIRMVITRR